MTDILNHEEDLSPKPLEKPFSIERPQRYCALQGKFNDPRSIINFENPSANRIDRDLLRLGKDERDKEHDSRALSYDKLTHALTETSNALSLRAAAILERFRAELATLPASFAYDDRSNNLHNSVKRVLFHLWIGVEDKTENNSKYVIATGSEEPEERQKN